MRKGLVVLLVILLGVFGYKILFQEKTYQGELQPAPDATQALQKALESEKPIFLEFSSDNCPACRRAQPWIEEFYQNYGEQVTFIIADTLKGGSSLAQHIGIKAVPTFILFNKDGEVVDNFAGYPAIDSKKYLEDKIKVLLE